MKNKITLKFSYNNTKSLTNLTSKKNDNNNSNNKVNNHNYVNLINYKSIISLNKIRQLTQLKIISNMFKEHNSKPNTWNCRVIDDIIYNEKSHLVSVFKDYLIYDDNSEFMKRYYYLRESVPRLPKIIDYYTKNTRTYPNYSLMDGSKLIIKCLKKQDKLLETNNIIKKNRNFETINNNYKESNKIFSDNIIKSIDRVQPSYSIIKKFDDNDTSQSLISNYNNITNMTLNSIYNNLKTIIDCNIINTTSIKSKPFNKHNQIKNKEKNNISIINTNSKEKYVLTNNNKNSFKINKNVNSISKIKDNNKINYLNNKKLEKIKNNLHDKLVDNNSIENYNNSKDSYRKNIINKISSIVNKDNNIEIKKSSENVNINFNFNFNTISNNYHTNNIIPQTSKVFSGLKMLSLNTIDKNNIVSNEKYNIDKNKLSIKHNTNFTNIKKEENQFKLVNNKALNTICNNNYINTEPIINKINNNNNQNKNCKIIAKISMTNRQKLMKIMTHNRKLTSSSNSNYKSSNSKFKKDQNLNTITTTPDYKINKKNAINSNNLIYKKSISNNKNNYVKIKSKNNISNNNINNGTNNNLSHINNITYKTVIANKSSILEKENNNSVKFKAINIKNFTNKDTPESLLNSQNYKFKKSFVKDMDLNISTNKNILEINKTSQENNTISINSISIKKLRINSLKTNFKNNLINNINDNYKAKPIKLNNNNIINNTPYNKTTFNTKVSFTKNPIVNTYQQKYKTLNTEHSVNKFSLRKKVMPLNSNKLNVKETINNNYVNSRLNTISNVDVYKKNTNLNGNSIFNKEKINNNKDKSNINNLNNYKNKNSYHKSNEYLNNKNSNSKIKGLKITEILKDNTNLEINKNNNINPGLTNNINKTNLDYLLNTNINLENNNILSLQKQTISSNKYNLIDKIKYNNEKNINLDNLSNNLNYKNKINKNTLSTTPSLNFDAKKLNYKNYEFLKTNK